jgi:chromosome segregation ATPase
MHDMENTNPQKPESNQSGNQVGAVGANKRSDEIRALETLLKDNEMLLEASRNARNEIEARHEAQLREAEDRLKQLETLVVQREAELQTIKFRADGLDEQVKQLGADKDRMISEVARLNEELKEKKQILAQRERDEWQAIGWRNGLKRKLGRLGARFANGAQTEKSNSSSDEQFPFTQR